MGCVSYHISLSALFKTEIQMLVSSAAFVAHAVTCRHYFRNNLCDD